jgi:hypothetical protein
MSPSKKLPPVSVKKARSVKAAGVGKHQLKHVTTGFNINTKAKRIVIFISRRNSKSVVIL